MQNSSEFQYIAIDTIFARKEDSLLPSRCCPCAFIPSSAASPAYGPAWIPNARKPRLPIRLRHDQLESCTLSQDLGALAEPVS